MLCLMTRGTRTRGLGIGTGLTVDRLTGFALALVNLALGGAQQATGNRVTSLWNAAEESSVR